MLCNDVQRESVEPSPDLASGLFCYAPLHNIWYDIVGLVTKAFSLPVSRYNIRSYHAVSGIRGLHGASARASQCD